MTRLLWLLRRRGGAIALVLGALLMAFALVLNHTTLQPLQQRIDELLAERGGARDTRLDQLGGELAQDSSPQAQLASFYRYFPADERLTDRLSRVHALARQAGLEMRRGEYRMSGGAAERKLDRYQMILPLQGRYPEIREFAGAVLRELPTAALDQVQFQRKDIGDERVDAQVTITFYLPR